ncbi:MAG: hypothetical protein OXQ89_24710 [Rhodospirillaceae bacterium]|nr:hypothetical protein [Rhodospirillaceae bacterium]MDE0000950.1 hypothetical protein [Rhodospirillaceae bacterium]
MERKVDFSRLVETIEKPPESRMTEVERALTFFRAAPAQYAIMISETIIVFDND